MMLNARIPQNVISMVKRHLNITWSDEDTDAKLLDAMQDAEEHLNDVLGCEVDYFTPGTARRLYLDCILYFWNNVGNEFDSAYMSDIYAVRRKYEVGAGTIAEISI